MTWRCLGGGVWAIAREVPLGAPRSAPGDRAGVRGLMPRPSAISSSGGSEAEERPYKTTVIDRRRALGLPLWRRPSAPHPRHKEFD